MAPEKEPPEAVAERQRNYKTSRVERGEVRVSTWVPKDKAKQLRDIASMWRREAEIRDGETRPARLDIPKIDIPDYPLDEVEILSLEIGQEEVALQKLIKHNGGEWDGRRKLWHLRADLVEPLGLQSRVVRNTPKLPPDLQRKQDELDAQRARQMDIESFVQARRPPPAPTAPEKIGRNQPCPCGSGKKYKRCCGKT